MDVIFDERKPIDVSTSSHPKISILLVELDSNPQLRARPPLQPVPSPQRILPDLQEQTPSSGNTHGLIGNSRGTDDSHGKSGRPDYISSRSSRHGNNGRPGHISSEH
jgi:hypothetical protein